MNILLFALSTLCSAAALPPVTDLVPSETARNMGSPYYSGAILPAPTQVEYRDATVTLIDGPGGEWFYRVLFECEGPSRNLAERLLNNRIQDYNRQFPNLHETTKMGILYPIVFTLANDERAKPYLKQFGFEKETSTLKPQGYLLEITRDGVLCVGADGPGLVNGAASLLQLLHVRDTRLVLQEASVVDWPAFLVRYVGEYHFPDDALLDWLLLHKLNGFAASYRALLWSALDDAKRQGLKRIGQYIEKYGSMHFMAQFHIGGRQGPVLDCGNPADVDRLLATLRETVTLSHADHIMICYDDVDPKLQPLEKDRFASTAEAHGNVMQQVYETVKALEPEAAVSFCTPYYQGNGHRRWQHEESRAKGLQYLAGVGQWPNKDIRIVWTGPVTESRKITVDDIETYQQWFGGNVKLFYWDNTWHYHQPLRDFHAQYPKDFVDECADRAAYLNINGTTPMGKFFAATAADYYWNPESFDFRRTRAHVVAQSMGPAAVPAAERFYALRGDSYFADFARGVNLNDLKQVLTDLERASLDPKIPVQCWETYMSIAKRRGTS